MRKSLTWAAVGTTIAAAVLSVAGTASASTAAPAKAPTTLLVGAAHWNSTPGAKDTITGVLESKGKPVASKWVKLFAVSKGHLEGRGIVAHETGPRGGVSFSVAPTATTTYELVFSGTAAYASSHSAPATIRVHKVPTTLAVTVAAAKNAPKDDVITGTLKVDGKPVAGRWVYEYKQVTNKDGKKSWKGVAGKETGKAGNVFFGVPVTSTATTYELVFWGGEVLAASHSVPVTIG